MDKKNDRQHPFYSCGGYCPDCGPWFPLKKDVVRFHKASNRWLVEFHEPTGENYYAYFSEKKDAQKAFRLANKVRSAS